MYGVGSPAGELGTVTEEFIKSAGNEPFEKLGELYSEFIQSLDRGSGDQAEKADIVALWGVSMGASLASATGESLLKQGHGTQSHEEARQAGKSFIRVDMYAPAATSESVLRRSQIPIGFAAEFVIQGFWGPKYNANVATKEKQFHELTVLKKSVPEN